MEIAVGDCRRKFLGRIYLHSNCEYKCKSDANTRELRENHMREKLRSKERETIHSIRKITMSS